MHYSVYRSCKIIEANLIQNFMEAVSHAAYLHRCGDRYIITSRYHGGNVNLIYSSSTILGALLVEDSLLNLNGNACLETTQEYVDSFFCQN